MSRGPGGWGWVLSTQLCVGPRSDCVSGPELRVQKPTGPTGGHPQAASSLTWLKACQGEEFSRACSQVLNKGTAPHPPSPPPPTPLSPPYWTVGTHTPPLSGSAVLEEGFKIPLKRVLVREEVYSPHSCMLHASPIPVAMLYFHPFSGWKFSFKDSFLPSTEGRAHEPILANYTVAP